MFTCDECGREHEHEPFVYEGHQYCEECVEDLFTNCEECGCIIPTDDAHWCTDSEMYVCNYCFDRDYGVCDDCGETYANGNLTEASNGHRVCSGCVENYYTCHSCGAVLAENDVLWHDDEGYCEECYDEIEDEEGGIHEYYYKPTPMFKGDSKALHIGMELEIDEGGEDEDNANTLLNILNKNSEIDVYAKHDGSLNNGIEFVTHPMTLQYIKELPWDEFCREAVHLGYRSHDSGKCGLHIHVSRTQLECPYWTEKVVIERILWFMQENWERLVIFSRRRHGDLNQWAAPYPTHETLAALYNDAITSGRYHSLNLNNAHTIEFRFFRGSLRPQTILAALELVEAIVSFCQTDYSEVHLTWQEFLKFIPEEKYQELMSYLKMRGLDKTDESEEI